MISTDQEIRYILYNTDRISSKIRRALESKGVEVISLNPGTMYVFRGNRFQEYNEFYLELDELTQKKLKILESHYENSRALFQNENLRASQINPLHTKLVSMRKNLEEHIESFQENGKIPQYIKSLIIRSDHALESGNNVVEIGNSTSKDITSLRNQFEKKFPTSLNPNSRKIRHLMNLHVVSEYEKSKMNVSPEEFTYHYVLGLNDVEEQFRYVLSFTSH